MPDNEIAVIAPSSSIESAERADQVLSEIMNIKSTLVKRALALGRLLREASENDYHHQWGYARFGDWVEQASGLDMSARSAYDLIKLIVQSERLGIPDETLEKVKISKLKKIFTLKPEQMDDENIRELVEAAETMRLDDVAEQVDIAQDQEWVNRNYKFDKTGYEQSIRTAIDRAKREAGSTINDEGTESDISDSKAIEYICADFNAGPEAEEFLTIDGNFHDVFQDTTETEITA